MQASCDPSDRLAPTMNEAQRSNVMTDRLKPLKAARLDSAV